MNTAYQANLQTSTSKLLFKAGMQWNARNGNQDLLGLSSMYLWRAGSHNTWKTMENRRINRKLFNSIYNLYKHGDLVFFMKKHF